MYKAKFKKYVEYFALKDIDSLAKMFTNYITLHDWDINVSGKSDVINANKEIFSSVRKINVNIVSIYSCERTVVAQLDIVINESKKLDVVNIISFDNEGKILAIQAFKR